MYDEIKSTFLKGLIVCYFCNDDIHNFETENLFDGRIVTACYECYRTLEIGKELYFSRINGVAAS